ncbi:MAG: methylenetetrahydrofolate reductase [NAD(P)H] [Candidatus Parabeggiatoa sp. nov. 2]|nr:MAG: methylenetetrahydrofolate reductase [NAD(P)H] [Beggiatoa sp. 4572_84]RKZ61985.1 MAG: methylenetetrahydrofolate reductase [NAD(P)H] [Gammaproteobacteria bacterium]HEC84278.1 methylenetetrahydrofolate reductase [NAD(P)H] [Thioploca sp.]
MTSQIPALTISCEFFPPRTEKGVLKLRQTREQLQALQPAYFSVTFGAGGSTQEKTFETVVEIQEQSDFDAAPHLSCIGSSGENVLKLLQNYQAHGIRRIVALRGDKPSGWAGPLGDFRYANELVEFIRTETGSHFHIEVAAYPEFHPEARSAKADLDFFKQKVDAGANSAITQYFYNAEAYFRLLDSCAERGIDIPIVPGIMPIGNYEQLVRFSDTCGAEVPRWLRRRLADFAEDKEGLQAFGINVVTKLCERLLEGGAPGLHFYTLNQAGPTLEITKRLGLFSLS